MNPDPGDEELNKLKAHIEIAFRDMIRRPMPILMTEDDRDDMKRYKKMLPGMQVVRIGDEELGKTHWV